MKFGSYSFSFFVIYILYIIATKTVCFNEPGHFSLRNISTLYRGTWSLLPRNFMMNMTDYDNESLNFDLKTTSSVDGVLLFQRRMKFSKMGGNVVFEIASTKTEIEEMDKIEVGDRFGVLYVEHQFFENKKKGDLLIRNGVYSTDEDKRYSLQGVYFWKHSILFLVANPTRYLWFFEKISITYWWKWLVHNATIRENEKHGSFPILNDFRLNLTKNFTKTILINELQATQKNMQRLYGWNTTLPLDPSITKNIQPVCYFSFILSACK